LVGKVADGEWLLGIRDIEKCGQLLISEVFAEEVCGDGVGTEFLRPTESDFGSGGHR